MEDIGFTEENVPLVFFFFFFLHRWVILRCVTHLLLTTAAQLSSPQRRRRKQMGEGRKETERRRRGRCDVSRRWLSSNTRLQIPRRLMFFSILRRLMFFPILRRFTFILLIKEPTSKWRHKTLEVCNFVIHFIHKSYTTKSHNLEMLLSNKERKNKIKTYLIL